MVFSTGAFKAALRLSPSTVLVSAGSMTPSSHTLNINHVAINLLQEMTKGDTTDNKDDPIMFVLVGFMNVKLKCIYE